jgi:hypothetical protein
MLAPPPAFSLESPRVRIQRFGAPLAMGKALARIAASMCVAAGLAGAAGLARGGGPLVGLLILAALTFLLGVLAALPLLLALAVTWVLSLLAPSRWATLSVGQRVHVESATDIVVFGCADVVSVELASSGSAGAPRCAAGSSSSAATIHMAEGDVIRLQLVDPDEASRFVAALAQGSAEGTWLAPLQPEPSAGGRARWIVASTVTAAALAAFALVPGPESLAGLFGGLGAVLWLTVLRPGPMRRRLAIGSDGVALRTDTGSRFISFDRIERVDPTDTGVVLALAGGERIALSVVPPIAMAGVAAVELGWLRRKALLSRLGAALSASGAVSGAERLSRQGRSLREWREAVRALVQQDAPGYRTALLPPEQAARIVETGRASPGARIGAALALAGHRDPAFDRRLRVAIESCADEATRLALDAALDDRLESWTLERVERAHGR